MFVFSSFTSPLNKIGPLCGPKIVVLCDLIAYHESGGQHQMTLSDLMDIVVSSSRTDWHHIACWGGGSGPSYRYQLAFSGGSQSNLVGGEAYGNTAIYMPDISITMAFGLRAVDDFKEDWVERFPKPHASTSLVDLFYNGTLVYRDTYVNVDGDRAKLPLPRIIRDKKTNKVAALQVPRREYQFFSLLDRIEGPSEFDRYFEQAGFEVVDEPWPDFRR